MKGAWTNGSFTDVPGADDEETKPEEAEEEENEKSESDEVPDMKPNNASIKAPNGNVDRFLTAGSLPAGDALGHSVFATTSMSCPTTPPFGWSSAPRNASTNMAPHAQRPPVISPVFAASRPPLSPAMRARANACAPVHSTPNQPPSRPPSLQSSTTNTPVRSKQHEDTPATPQTPGSTTSKHSPMVRPTNKRFDGYGDFEKKHVARGFGGAYKNRRAKIHWLDGEKVHKNITCSMVLNSMKLPIQIKFLVSNYRIGLKLLDTLLPRAVSIPLCYIEKVRYKAKGQNDSKTSLRAALTEEERSRSPSPSGLQAGGSTTFTSEDFDVSEAANTSNQSMAGTEQTAFMQSSSTLVDDLEREARDAQREREQNRPRMSGQEGILEIQTKGVPCYNINMKTEDIVAVRKLLHSLTSNSTRKPPFCAVYQENYKGSAQRDKCEEVPIALGEFERMTRGTPPHVATHWQVFVNHDYMVPTYPKVCIVPAAASSKLVENVINFRTKSRFPIVSWIHPETGTAICRSSQPKVGFGGKRSLHDEKYISLLGKPRALDADKDTEEEATTVVILDCRPFANAVANRSRAGGYEDEKNYPGCTYENADIGNIHDITNSLKLLRKLAEMPPNQLVGQWAPAIHNTGWLRHIEKILLAAIRTLQYMDSGCSVLVHCSDGWDRTSQVVALAKLLVDPFYRTFEGFQVLIQFDWLAAGHKFADRNFNIEGCMDRSETSPIFMQWIDAVWQVWKQYPTQFEFSEQYLTFILYHSLSGRFATFLYNCEKERAEAGNTGISLWSYLNSPEQRYHRPEFSNVLYNPKNVVSIRPVGWPKVLHLWEDVHMKLESEWLDLWNEPVSDKLMQIGRELEDHRSKRPRFEAALKKRTAGLNTFTAAKHLSTLMEVKEVHIQMVSQILEDAVLQRVYDYIDATEVRRARQNSMDGQSTIALEIYRGQGTASVLGPGGRWVPDNMAPCCAACLKPFQWWRRRHHCRLCGNVFCGTCSQSRRALSDHPQAGTVRVCDDCAEVITRETSNATPYNSPEKYATPFDETHHRISTTSLPKTARSMSTSLFPPRSPLRAPTASPE